MNALLSMLGLGLDLIGVLILGFDVLSIQRTLRISAKKNSVLLYKAFKNTGLLAEISTYPENDDNAKQLFRGYFQLDESKLSNSLDALKDEIGTAHQGIENVIAYLVSSVRHQSDAALESLKLTYLGLVPIVFGFFLQSVGVVVVNRASWEIF